MFEPQKASCAYLYKYSNADHLEWLRDILFNHAVYFPSHPQLNGLRTTRRRISASTPGRPPYFFAYVPLRTISCPMPPKNRVGRDDRGDVLQAATAKPMAMHRQPTAFRIGQAVPAAHVPTQDAVLFDQVGHDVLLPPVEPAGQRGEQQAERHRVGHGARVYTTDPISGPQSRRPSNETIRGGCIGILQRRWANHNFKTTPIDHSAIFPRQTSGLNSLVLHR